MLSKTSDTPSIDDDDDSRGTIPDDVIEEESRLMIVTRCQTVDDFLSTFARHGAGELLASTRRARPIGTRFRVSVLLADRETRVLRGRARVIESLSPADSGLVRIRLRFFDVDPAFQSTFDDLVARGIAHRNAEHLATLAPASSRGDAPHAFLARTLEDVTDDALESFVALAIFETPSSAPPPPLREDPPPSPDSEPRPRARRRADAAPRNPWRRPSRSKTPPPWAQPPLPSIPVAEPSSAAPMLPPAIEPCVADTEAPLAATEAPVALTQAPVAVTEGAPPRRSLGVGAAVVFASFSLAAVLVVLIRYGHRADVFSAHAHESELVERSGLEGGAVDAPAPSEMAAPTSASIDPVAPAEAPVASPKECRISVAASPSSSMVFWNEEPLGKAPLTRVAVSCGKGNLRVTAPGFADLERSATVQRGIGALFVERLRPSPVELTIATDPPGATIVVDGRPAGVSPAVIEARPFTTIDIVATAQGYGLKGKRVSVGAKAIRVDLTLDRRVVPGRAGSR